MRSLAILSVGILSWLPTLYAQSPFQFREAWLLEHRIEVTRSGEEYDPSHSEQLLSREGPGPAEQFIPDRGDVDIYRTERWKALLDQTDRYRRMGGLELAQEEYLDIIAKLRQAQGPNSNDEALMLDHLGEFYLEVRNFDAAYSALADALKVRMATIARLPPAAASAPESQTSHIYRLHLADLETRLGQLDYAKGDLASANKRLTQAIAISSEPAHQRFVVGLYALYFESLVLEKQQRWQEAETLWRNAIEVREKLFLSEPYWNAQKEMAAFFARKGDFHAAAEIAQKVITGIAGKQLRPELPMPYLDSRPRAVLNQPQYSLYLLESNTAMSEILAIDKWRTDGPDAAAPLLKDLIVPQNRDIISRGSDSERTELLAWFERRAFLHMSILLDGKPSQDRIDKAYATLSEIKGRYLSAISSVTRMYEQERGNPNTQIKEFAILDQLAKARENHSHSFVEAALDQKKLKDLELAAEQNTEQILSSALLAGPGAGNAYSYFSLPGLIGSLSPDAAFVDLVVWDRSDREGKAPPQRVYGAFVARKGQPLEYVQIGAADSIDTEIDLLHAGVIGSRQRGLVVENPKPASSVEDTQRILKSLYHKAFAPLEASLQGATILYIVPDGKLSMAPISAFIDEKGRYIFEGRTISYLDSWRDLGGNGAAENQKQTAPVVVANPDFDLALQGTSTGLGVATRPTFKSLPGAAAEAADVAQAIKAPKDRVLTGKTARQWLIESLQSPSVIHFATHSIPYLRWNAPQHAYTLFEFPQPLNTEYPLLQSMIALAGANRPQNSAEDGLLTGLEVSSLHLQATNLVVLSSCESGQGTLVDGQGVLGLRAAFAMAGAQSLVMTLWPVDDQAGRQFMQFFYSHLSEGPAAAVRQSQEDMLTKTEYKNPFYWSGYVVSGVPLSRSSHQTQTAAAGVQPTPASPASASSNEALITPRCFEFRAKESSKSSYTNLSDIRLRIGGVVHRTQVSPDRVDYDLAEPGNELDVHDSMSVNGGPPIPNPDVYIASQMHWAVDLVIERRKDHSSIFIRFGSKAQEPDKRRRILLSGSSTVFPSFDIPEQMPPISAFTQAIYTFGDDEPIQQAGFCSATP